MCVCTVSMQCIWLKLTVHTTISQSVCEPAGATCVTKQQQFIAKCHAQQFQDSISLNGHESAAIFTLNNSFSIRSQRYTSHNKTQGVISNKIQSAGRLHVISPDVHYLTFSQDVCLSQPLYICIMPTSLTLEYSSPQCNICNKQDLPNQFWPLEHYIYRISIVRIVPWSRWPMPFWDWCHSSESNLTLDGMIFIQTM